VLIDHGRVVAAGTPSELKSQIGDQRVDVVGVDASAVVLIVDALSATFQVVVDHNRRTVSVPAPHDLADLAAVTSALSGVGAHIDEIALRRPTLDDAFLALTGQVPESYENEPAMKEVTP
jgi:ABC-type multidrug transport system ATPase subunit